MNRWILASRLTGVGWYVGGCIALGTFGGIWLDGRIDSDPLFTLLGLGLGIVMAFYGMYRMLTQILRDKNGKE